jgi:protein-disulfide isomerase
MSNASPPPGRDRDVAPSLDLSVGAGRTGGAPGDLDSGLDLSAGAGRTAGLSDKAAQALAPGTLLANRYEVRALLGAGGMGVVYRVRDGARGKDVALKVMLPSLLAREKAAERFSHEAEIMLGLAHEGIVRVFDVGLDTARGLRFYTMELLEGMSLRAWLEAKKQAKEPVDPKEALEVARQLLEALRYAHRVTVHRDLKPENVFLVDAALMRGTMGTSGAAPGALRAKILDFGIAKLQTPSQFTSTSMALGTAYYMAPEQQLDAAKVDQRADLYSVCVILYEMLTGELPVGRFRTPSEERKALPRALDEVVLRGLETKPERRPDSADRLLAEVAAIRGLLEGGRARRSRALPVAALLLLAGAGATAIALLRPWERGREAPMQAEAPAPPPTPAAAREPPKRAEGPAGAPARVAEAPEPPPAAPVVLLALEPPAGRTSLLREPVIHVRGRVSGAAAGAAVRVGEPGKPAVEKPLDAEGGFDVRLGLDADARAVEVHAGDAVATIPVEIDARAPEVALEAPPRWREGPIEVAATVRAAHPRVARFSVVTGVEDAAPALERPVGANGRATATLDVPDDAARENAVLVRVEAEDALGRTARAEREVAIEPPAPVVAAAPSLPPPAPLPGSGFAARSGGRRNLVARGGGSQATESAVLAGLRWLARHQGEDGGWHAADFAAGCTPGAKCGGEGARDEGDVGVTGLALLAFLGAGTTYATDEAYEDPHTHRQVAFGDCVARAIAYLRAAQAEDGCLGPRTTIKLMYDHAIGALALVEAYGMSGAPEIRASAAKAIDFLRAAQNPGLGWRYSVRPGDNDTSVTGWCVAALVAAEAVGISTDHAALEGATSWIDRATKQDGEVGYNQAGSGLVYIPGKNEAWTGHPTMTAIGLLCRIEIGRDRKGALLEKGGALVAKDLPAWDEARHTVDFYYWHQGTLALYQLDGPGGKYWKPWNAAMTRALVPHQKVAADGCEDGSWDPAADRWGAMGGRVYATAMNVLTLETYYRSPLEPAPAAGAPAGQRHDAAAAPQGATTPPPTPPAERIAVDPGNGPSIGPASAPVTIVEFADFQCPYCRKSAPVLKQLVERYEGRVRIVWRNEPLVTHRDAAGAAEAAMAAAAQGKFWQMHDRLFESQQALDRSSLERYGREIGLDVEQFRAALDAREFRAAVEADLRYANSLGVSATPTFFLNGRQIAGAMPFETFASAIEEELKKRGR